MSDRAILQIIVFCVTIYLCINYSLWWLLLLLLVF